MQTPTPMPLPSPALGFLLMPKLVALVEDGSWLDDGVDMTVTVLVAILEAGLEDDEAEVEEDDGLVEKVEEEAEGGSMILKRPLENAAVVLPGSKMPN